MTGSKIILLNTQNIFIVRLRSFQIVSITLKIMNYEKNNFYSVTSGLLKANKHVHNRYKKLLVLIKLFCMKIKVSYLQFNDNRDYFQTLHFNFPDLLLKNYAQYLNRTSFTLL